ncbi:MAG: PaaI family thioesterase [Desulfobacteraceae bacterium]|jgi:uncharacterized protein (TIGR00369 family)|nr:MAG: PaaI family thioesterase [Desulfobacteraceae bacterium]
MPELNPDHVAAISETVNNCPFFKLLSMELKGLGRGESILEIQVQEKHLQPYGIVHGGVCASVMDAAVYWAVYAAVERSAGLTTVEIKINYLAPVKSGRLLARGRSIKVGKTICLGEAFIENGDGALIAHGTGTLMVIDSLEIKGQSRLPPKWLATEK